MTITILEPLTPAEIATNRASTVARRIADGRRCAVEGDIPGARWYRREARRLLALVNDADVLRRILVGSRVLDNLITMGAE